MSDTAITILSNAAIVIAGIVCAAWRMGVIAAERAREAREAVAEASRLRAEVAAEALEAKAAKEAAADAAAEVLRIAAALRGNGGTT